MSGSSSTSANTIAQKLLVRLFMASMRFEGMWALGLRRSLIDRMSGCKHQQLNIFAHVFIEGFEGLKIGNHVSINRGSNLSCFGGVTIEDHVAIGHGTSIISNNHGYSDRETPINYQPVLNAPVHIGRNVWIGAQVIILPGVSIAEGTIVAAGAVVTHSVTEPNMIIAGVPAKVIKARFPGG
jgi:acetyltransferase-like isoleucine patch superfamily enzyme